MDARSVPFDGSGDTRYWITERGSIDLRDCDTCECVIAKSKDFLLCASCFTVYGLVADYPNWFNYLGRHV